MKQIYPLRHAGNTPALRLDLWLWIGSQTQAMEMLQESRPMEIAESKIQSTSINHLFFAGTSAVKKRSLNQLDSTEAIYRLVFSSAAVEICCCRRPNRATSDQQPWFLQAGATWCFCKVMAALLPSERIALDSATFQRHLGLGLEPRT